MLPPPKPPLAPAPKLILPAGCDEVLHLMGSTNLAEFLDYACENADPSVQGSGAVSGNSQMDLAEAWRDAAMTYEGLMQTEAYPTEALDVYPLPDSMRAHCEQFLARPQVQREFNRVPVAFGMVPLAHLIAAQDRLNVGTVTSVGIGTGAISDASLIQICLPLDAPHHTLEVLHKDTDSVTFAADNHDIRFLRPQLLSGLVENMSNRGHVQRTLALPVGFSINVLNVVRFQNRLILNNGYHRAFALWRRGVTHVPAVIQVCRHWEDVGLVGSSEIYENGALYIDRQRPPLLKDFVNRNLCMTFAVRRQRKYLRIRFQVETGYLAM